MSAALARRDEGCASDLLMDRWLLGEIPGSDEARRLEQHVRTCGTCEGRLLALRSLYGSRPAPRPARAERPRLVTVPQDGPVAQSGVLQVVILRDGLLVGTEVFTPGRYEIGKDAICALRLEDVEGSHAVLHLRGGRIAIEARKGQVFVNGYRVECCELRPIDEVCVGNYVLRTRLIDREDGAAAEKTDTARVPAPVRNKGHVALKLELYWGDRLQSAAVFDRAPTPSELEPWGLMEAVAIDGGFELDAKHRVRHGDSVQLERGPLTIIASAVPVQVKAPNRAPVREWPWPFLSMATTLALGVILFGVFAPVPDNDPPFATKEWHADAHFLIPPKPPKLPKMPKAPESPPSRVTHVPPHRRPNDPIRLTPPAIIKRDLVGGVLSALDRIGMRGEKRGGKSGHAIAALGLPGIGKALSAPGLGLGDGGGGIRIGGAGAMTKGHIGEGGPLGKVTSEGRVRTSNDAWIDRDAVAKVVQAHTSEISHCYETAMLSNGSFSGKMQVEWVIDESGSVRSSRIKSTDIKNAQFGTCVLAALGTWKFPPAHGRVTVSYPFHLSSVGY